MASLVDEVSGPKVEERCVEAFGFLALSPEFPLELKMTVSRGGCSCQSGLIACLVKGRESRLVLRTGSGIKQKEKKRKKRRANMCTKEKSRWKNKS
jgi:hypothetical protein